ncbi:glutaminase A [Planococcus lenghuensis]|uniref:Glutaminase n=1 Tax=Planococcus lenghuensis TaxID=2213202 RepID=A0A1Q2KZ48_9BACL|nr:glutaminase A [Planococcus lenghuensis]AQQ53478.1 glutaminase A [Planococcus lenghuensis]
MEQLSQAYLEKTVLQSKPFSADGKVKETVPGINSTVEGSLGLAVCTVDGKEFEAGLTDYRFTLQSISKVINLMIALQDAGPEAVFKQVGMEPTSQLFDSVKGLTELGGHKPFNPFIDEGAIAITSLITGKNSEERFNRIIKLLRKITGNAKLRMNEAAYEEAKRDSSKSYALAYYLESESVIENGKVEEALDLYFRGLSIEVNALELARIGAFFARDGYMNGEDEPLIKPDHISIMKALMLTSGLYNDSGKMAVQAGIPAKSGIGGGIVAAATGIMGIGIFGPALNAGGNSTAGMEALKHLSRNFDLNIFKRSSFNPDKNT